MRVPRCSGRRAEARDGGGTLTMPLQAGADVYPTLGLEHAVLEGTPGKRTASCSRSMPTKMGISTGQL